MRRDDAFGGYHPAITFLMFMLAVVLCVVVQHPAFHAVAVVAGAAYYLMARGRAGVAVVAGMVPVFVALTVLNAVFVPLGNTVLFTYFGGRPFTLEAFAHGASTAALFVSVMLWFFAYNRVMTSDKFTYLFGGLAPAVTLMFTMVLRLVPTYQRKAAQLSAARASVGRAASEGTLATRVDSGVALVSVLATWALEHAVTTADSMRSRGFGAGKRTQFAHYRLVARDKVLLAAIFALALAACAGIAGGAAHVDYIPAVVFPPLTPLYAATLASYAALLFIPFLIDVREVVLWRISLSRI